MRKLRRSFEFLAGISNDQNDLINRGKTPKGFQLLDAKDTTREADREHAANTDAVTNPRKQGFFKIDHLKFRNKKMKA